MGEARAQKQFDTPALSPIEAERKNCRPSFVKSVFIRGFEFGPRKAPPSESRTQLR
jgi:hypothetical protein